MQSYSKGVNEYVKQNMLPIQYYIFWMEYDDWTIADSCSILKFMQLLLNHNFGDEIARDYVDAFSNDPDLAKKLIPYDISEYGEYTTSIITDLELMRNKQFVNNTDMKHPEHERKANPNLYHRKWIGQENLDLGIDKSVGSNSYVISGKYTKSGKPIFSNDPHLGNNVPSTWHLSRIIYPDGFYIAGA